MRRMRAAYWGLLACIPFSVLAADANLENGAALHKKCALCHGHLSQGIPGGLYPRLAGWPVEYLIKQMQDYKNGVREDPAMVVVGGLNTISEQERLDLASYIASIDLDKQAPLNIPVWPGTDVTAGEEMYQDDCKTCHGKRGEGRPKKDAPPLAGQYTEYLDKQIKHFKVKKRHHDNDPDDETFEDYNPKQLRDILGYIATLDDKK